MSANPARPAAQANGKVSSGGCVFYGEACEFIEVYTAAINAGLAAGGGRPLTRIQSGFLRFCLMGIIVTNCVCWARFQLRGNQIFRHRGAEYPVGDIPRLFRPVERELPVRGGKARQIVFSCARLLVHAHGKKRFVIAITHKEEKEYSYLAATDMSWRGEDIINAYALRWLAEVFFEDWKTQEGWAKLTKLQGAEGSCRGLILSLLADHCLFFHPSQLARLDAQLPAFTVGSLRAQIVVDALFQVIGTRLASENPQVFLEQLRLKASELFVLAESGKHMSGRDLGRLEPSENLKSRAAKANAGD